MMKLLLPWPVVAFFFIHCLGAAAVAGFLIPKIQPQPQDSGALMSSNAIKTQELSLAKGHERRLTAPSPSPFVLTESSPIFVPPPQQQQQQQQSDPLLLLLLHQQYQTTISSIHTDERSMTTLGTIMSLAVVAILAATDSTGYSNLQQFLPNVVDAMIPTSMNDTVAWALGEAAGLALVALCSVLLRLSSHPIGSDREHHDLFCPAEILADIIMWLEFAVLQDYSGTVVVGATIMHSSNAGWELALFGSISGASSLMYADILSGIFRIGSTSRREIVLSRKWSDWIRIYFFRCISSVTLFSVFDRIEQLLSSSTSF